MLASFPMSRGRSRQVSRAAVARKASEERRAQARRPATATPAVRDQQRTPAYVAHKHDSAHPRPNAKVLDTDSDPVSLADRVHTAYALDDMHTAKVLLLKLKGYRDITEADIAAVQDEDFDFCFVPNGRLVEDISCPTPAESASTMQPNTLSRTRDERLKACEKVWEDGRRAMAESRQAMVLQQKRAQLEREVAQRKRAEVEAEERRLEAERIVMSTHHVRRRQRPVVSYAELSPSSPSPTPTRHRSPTLYDCPALQPAPRPSHSRQKSSLSMSLDQPLPEMSQVVVPFKDVVKSMHGALFPLDPEERMSHTRSREKELLMNLLAEAEVVAAEAEKTWKGKGAAAAPGRRRSVVCPACEKSLSTSSTSSTTSTRSLSSASSGPSRSGSWLSFSVSTALTTPATSPRRSRIGSWLLKPTVAAPTEITTVTRRCCATHCHLVAVSVPIHDSPLPFPQPEPAMALESSSVVREARRASAASAKADAQAGLVSQVLSYAQNFQRAYAGALLFSSVPTSSPYEFGEPARRRETTAPRRSGRSIRAPGYRASRTEVSRVFPARHVTIRRHVDGDGWDQASDFLGRMTRGTPSRFRSSLPRRLRCSSAPLRRSTRSTRTNGLYLRLKATHNVLTSRRGATREELDVLQGKTREKVGRVSCISVPVAAPTEVVRAEREVYGARG
ncbi:hypothetical protein BD626DRAFT_501384 [Schizophyllum amplum]|uniref:Uncharacterized protein n=1 Tax=Schizophyllum amplum TaxID=97359 RepID=A0A550C9R9_9AGAR|nr:hypothetical protein BD626DRAFT_501384 [Auriculariopsis ampla]